MLKLKKNTSTKEFNSELSNYRTQQRLFLPRLKKDTSTKQFNSGLLSYRMQQRLSLLWLKKDTSAKKLRLKRLSCRTQQRLSALCKKEENFAKKRCASFKHQTCNPNQQKTAVPHRNRRFFVVLTPFRPAHRRNFPRARPPHRTISGLYYTAAHFIRPAPYRCTALCYIFLTKQIIRFASSKPILR